MVERKQVKGYLDHVQEFLDLNFEDGVDFVETVMKHEPEGRVEFDSEKQQFRLGMCQWDLERTRGVLKEIQDAVREFMTDYAAGGRVSETGLNKINSVSHDLRIQYNYSPDGASHLKLNYVVPDSRIAWEEGKCPHCGDTVTIHICPDPIPVTAYEAIINTLRLASRHVNVSIGDGGRFYIP